MGSSSGFSHNSFNLSGLKSICTKLVNFYHIPSLDSNEAMTYHPLHPPLRSRHNIRCISKHVPTDPQDFSVIQKTKSIRGGATIRVPRNLRPNTVLLLVRLHLICTNKFIHYPLNKKSCCSELTYYLYFNLFALLSFLVRLERMSFFIFDYSLNLTFHIACLTPED